MGLRRRPPQHRADAEAVLILRQDDAWDHERIEAEIAELVEEFESGSIAGDDDSRPAHPVEDYWAGRTRFDLDAPRQFRGKVVTAREYLDEAKSPVEFVLRKLDGSKYRRLQSKAVVDAVEATHEACRIGVKTCRGLKLPSAKTGRLNREDTDMLVDLDLDLDIGSAVFALARPLDDAEKKASAS